MAATRYCELHAGVDEPSTDATPAGVTADDEVCKPCLRPRPAEPLPDYQRGKTCEFAASVRDKESAI